MSDTMLSRTAPRDDKVELRYEVPKDEVAVLDGHCSATGRSRTDVLRELLAKWSGDELHKSILICRVAGINPMQADSDRNDTNLAKRY